MCKRVIALSLLLLLSFCSTSWAATYSITETQLTALEQNLNQLESINKVLTQNSDESKKDLLKALDELKLLHTQLKLSLNETTEARQDLSKANESLANLNQSFKMLEKEKQKAKSESTMWKFLTLVVGIYAVVK